MQYDVDAFGLSKVAELLAIFYSTEVPLHPELIHIISDSARCTGVASGQEPAQ